ncbi:MAG TPA: hypothetical protein PLB41_13650 [Rubrivivax sp.]|nr:hypothetical protein [Rubrivivax sp.]
MRRIERESPIALASVTLIWPAVAASVGCEVVDACHTEVTARLHNPFAIMSNWFA